MEICDEITLDEKKELFDEKMKALFFSLLSGQTVTETVKTSRGEFTVKYPKQKDVISIGRIAAYLRGGIPAMNFDAASDYEILKCATLDVMISDGPDWYKNAGKRDKKFSWRDVPDAHFTDEVYAKALQFRQRVQGQLAGNEEFTAEKPIGEDTGGVSADVGDGVYEGVSGSVKRTGS